MAIEADGANHHSEQIGQAQDTADEARHLRRAELGCI